MKLRTKIIYSALILVSFCKIVENANILFIAITPSRSHQLVFQQVWRELSLRGHNVHVLTPNPLKDPTLTNLTEVDLSSLYGIVRTMVPQETAVNLIMKPSFLYVFQKDMIMTDLWSKLHEQAFLNKNMQEFLKEDYEFDLVIAEWLYPTMAAFGARYKAPIIGITSLGAPIPALDTVGNPSHPVMAPDHNLPIGRDLTFRERVMSGLYAIYVRAYYHLFVLPREDNLAKKYLGEDLPYIGDIEKNISLLLLNRNPVFHRPMPVVPAIIELGGMSIKQADVELDPELQKFLDNSKNGAIYFSLGSTIRINMLPPHILESIWKVLSNLPYNVVWKWDEDEPTEKPQNIVFRKWLPQRKLLAHKNIRLFLMPGGLQSSEDAILSGVPVIGFPFQSDQTTNVDTCVKYGMGIMIDLEDITVENLNYSIHEIMTKPSYTESARRLSELLYDQPMDGLHRAVWWIEYVIRHKGARHLRSPSLDIPWISYLMLDVAAFLLTILVASFLIIYVVVKYTLRILFKIAYKVCKCSKSKNEESKKSKKDD